MHDDPNKKTIGLIVNPVAGMGGSVGLKGTDGGMYQRAVKLGAHPVTPARTQEFLAHLKRTSSIRLLTAPGKMGADHLADTPIEFTVVGSISDDTTSADTQGIVREMLAAGVELVVFVGGDGTSRDICDAIDAKVPVVAVPAGVKVYGGVFALSARAAAEMLDAYLEGTGFTEEEVLDIDEDAFREGRLESRIYGYLLVPEVRRFLQGGKEASDMSVAAVEAKHELAEWFVEQMEKDTLYLLGPGTTVKAIAEALNIPIALLGVDAILDGRSVGTDLNEQQILELLGRYDNRQIVVTPLGGNGFIFGRGNKQFTPEVIRRVGKDNVVVIAVREKLLKLPCLRVDTGEYALDRDLAGYIEVVTGFNRLKVVRVEC